MARTEALLEAKWRSQQLLVWLRRYEQEHGDQPAQIADVSDLLVVVTDPQHPKYHRIGQMTANTQEGVQAVFRWRQYTAEVDLPTGSFTIIDKSLLDAQAVFELVRFQPELERDMRRGRNNQYSRAI